MRELHVVALSEDGRHVVLATRKGAGRGEFRVAVDDRLAAALRGDLARPGERSLPHVTPKEIQARLRAGESVEDIARSAGMPATRVERFAGPVLSERERMIDGARAAIVNRSRRGPSGLPLGEAVDQHLAESAGYKPESTRWSARREETGRWLVEVSWVARAKQRSAGWRYDPLTKQVDPVDPASAVLAHVDPPESRREADPVPTTRVKAPGRAKAPARGSRSTAARPAAAARTPAGTPAARATPARPAVAPARTAARAPAARTAAAGTAAPSRTPAARTATPVTAAPRPAAARPAADRPAAARTVAPKATPAAVKPAAARVPAASAPAARTAAPARVTPAPSVAARPGADELEVLDPVTGEALETTTADAPVVEVAVPVVPSGPPTLRVVPPADADEPAEVDEPADTGSVRAEPADAEHVREEDAAAQDDPAEAEVAAEPTAKVRRAAGQRASVPSWSDVLLGTAPLEPRGGRASD